MLSDKINQQGEKCMKVIIHVGNGTQYQVRAIVVMDLWDLRDMIIKIHVCKWRQQYCVIIVVQAHHDSTYYFAENIVKGDEKCLRGLRTCRSRYSVDCRKQ